MMYLRVGPLVRAVSQTSVVIWAEVSAPCTVRLNAIAQNSTATQTRQSATINIGNHYYIAIQLQDLTPATWYDYHLYMLPEEKELVPTNITSLLQCFRTLETAVHQHSAITNTTQLRLAYGSCRKAELDQADAFSALGKWLSNHYEQREEHWPQLLLLIGDQIYADEPPTQMVSAYPHLQQGAKTFEDFALLYQHAWSQDVGVRQALAVLPTYMIFDDHEISNNWNFEPAWRVKAIQRGKEQIIVDGMVAYWVYQGWGNMEIETADHPLLHIMRRAIQSGEDILEDLRSCIQADVYGQQLLDWHYTIPSNPPIFVFNARTERTAVFNNNLKDLYAPMRILAKKQRDDLQTWLQNDPGGIALLASSVPVLLPPLIGMLEYLMGQRLWHTSTGVFGWLGRQLARWQQRFATQTSFDHWPVYVVTWRELISLLAQQQKDIIILSGDVHFAYSMQAHFTQQKVSPLIYQFVSTPIQNTLDRSSEQKIKLQAHLHQSQYGGIHAQILPLTPKRKGAAIEKNLLFENNIAIVTLQTNSDGQQIIQQEYLGCVNDTLEVVGYTSLLKE